MHTEKLEEMGGAGKTVNMRVKEVGLVCSLHCMIISYIVFEPPVVRTKKGTVPDSPYPHEWGSSIPL